MMLMAEGLRYWTLFFLHLVEEHRDRELLLLPFQSIKHLLEMLQGFRYRSVTLMLCFIIGS